MIRIIDIHDDELLIGIKHVRDAIKSIGGNILVVIHGYGSASSTSSYKKLTEVRNIGKSRVKKGELSLSIAGPDLNNPEIRSKFTAEELMKLNTYIINSGVTIMKK